MVRSGQVAGCAKMACSRQGAPFCAAYSDGRQCTDAMACTRATTNPTGGPARCPVVLDVRRSDEWDEGHVCPAGLTRGGHVKPEIHRVDP